MSKLRNVRGKQLERYLRRMGPTHMVPWCVLYNHQGRFPGRRKRRAWRY